MNIAIEENLILFFKAIEKYALGDLKKMLECVDYTKDEQRLAVPIALTCFSILDIMGFLVREIDIIEVGRDEAKIIKDINREMSNTKENTKTSIAIFFNEEIITTEQRELLCKYYRNGMAHNFFPKGLGIRNAKNESKILLSDGNIWHFNVYPFAVQIISNFSSVYEEILSEKRLLVLRNWSFYEMVMKKDFGGLDSELIQLHKITNFDTPQTTRSPFPYT